MVLAVVWSNVIMEDVRVERTGVGIIQLTGRLLVKGAPNDLSDLSTPPPALVVVRGRRGC
jgi:hypothetical protein